MRLRVKSALRQSAGASAEVPQISNEEYHANARRRLTARKEDAVDHSPRLRKKSSIRNKASQYVGRRLAHEPHRTAAPKGKGIMRDERGQIQPRDKETAQRR
jgi:hypothetical protein